MPNYKHYEDKTFKVKNLKTKVDDLQKDNPSIEQVIFELPGSSPERITCKPKKKVTKAQERNGRQVETDDTVPMTLGEEPDVFAEIEEALEIKDVVEVRANITRGTFEEDDSSTSKHFWINSDDMDSIVLLTVDHNEEKESSTAEDFVEDQTNIDTEESEEEVVDGSDDRDVLFGEDDN